MILKLFNVFFFERFERFFERFERFFLKDLKDFLKDLKDFLKDLKDFLKDLKDFERFFERFEWRLTTYIEGTGICGGDHIDDSDDDVVPGFPFYTTIAAMMIGFVLTTIKSNKKLKIFS